MQKSFSLACFIWNYAQLSNPAKYHLLRAREAGALGLPSVERWIPVRRPSRLAVARMSRRGGCWRGCAHLPSCSWGAGTAVGTRLPSPSPCVVPVNTSVVGCLSSKMSIFVFVWGFLHRGASGGGWVEAFTREYERREWLWDRTDETATGMTCEEHLYRPPPPATFSSG